MVDLKILKNGQLYILICKGAGTVVFHLVSVNGGREYHNFGVAGVFGHFGIVAVQGVLVFVIFRLG